MAKLNLKGLLRVDLNMHLITRMEHFNELVPTLGKGLRNCLDEHNSRSCLRSRPVQSGRPVSLSVSGVRTQQVFCDAVLPGRVVTCDVTCVCVAWGGGFSSGII